MRAKPIKFSIIVPTHKRSEQIVQCLESISMINYPKDCFEVIVIDDGYTLPNDFIAHFEVYFSLTFFQQNQSGPAKARNKGASLSNFEYLVFLDDDCQVDKEWLNDFSNTLRANPNTCVGGKVLNSLPKNTFSSASQELIEFLYGYFESTDNQMDFLTSNNIALAKYIFEEIDGFDETFPLAASEDRDFCKRLLEKDFKLIKSEQAKILHKHKLNAKSFCRQHFNYGRGAYFFHRRISERGFEKQSIQPLSFYINLLTSPFKNHKVIKSLRLSTLLFLSQFSTACGYYYQKYLVS